MTGVSDEIGRRRFLTLSTAVGIGGLAGCSGNRSTDGTGRSNYDLPENEETAPNDRTETPTRTDTATPTITDAKTTESSPTTAANTPTTTSDPTSTTEWENTTAERVHPYLNQTPYDAAWNPNVRGQVIPDSNSATSTALLTTENWEEKIRRRSLDSETGTLLAATDFETETVVVVQTPVSGGGNRLILRSVDGVGTRTVEVTLEEWHSRNGSNVAPDRLVLVQIPNRGTVPTTVEFTYQS